MNRAVAGRRSALARGRSWVLPRRDLADGAGMLLRLSHPLLPDFSSARGCAEGLRLGPPVPRPVPLSSSLDSSARGAYLVRLVSLAAFLKLHGLGIAPRDVSGIGARSDDPARPWLSAPPVPDWRAASPALVAAAVAARFGGASLEGEDAESMRLSVERAVEHGLASDPARDALTALRAEESGRRPEALLSELARKRDVGPLGFDLLGLVYPSVFASEAENGAIRSASGAAALWVVRGAARRQPEGFFVECDPGPPLEEGSALLGLTRMLDGDGRARFIERLAEGGCEGRVPAGVALALVARDSGHWDPRSRHVLETRLEGPGFTRYETRERPAPAWEPRFVLVPRLGVGEISSLLYLPHATLGQSVATWQTAARSAAGDPSRFLAAARRLATDFDPGESRDRPARSRPARAAREPLLEAASLLADGFTAAEAALAGASDPEEAAVALARAVERGTLIEDPGSFRFQEEVERRRMAAKTTSRARRDAVARLEKAGIERERLLVVALARGTVDDVAAAGVRLCEAVEAGDARAALQLLRRAPASSPDLGFPVLALNVLFNAGHFAEASVLVPRIAEEVRRALPYRERLRLAGRLVKLGDADRALALFELHGNAAETLGRARILVAVRREKEAARLLASPSLRAEELAPADKTQAALLRAEIAERRHDYDAAAVLLGEVQALLPGVADPGLAFEATLSAGYLAADMNRRDEALAFFRTGLAAAADEGQRADATFDISVVLMSAGRFAEAERNLETALELYKRCGNEARYLSALGNRVELLMRVGDFGAAWPALERVLSYDRAKGREHQFLFTVCDLQQLALLEGDVVRAAEAFGEAEARRSAAPEHTSWRKILVLEAARLLSSGRPGEALARLDEAGATPDNRMESEPLRLRLFASAGIDLGRPEAPPSIPSLSRGEKILLQAETRLGRGDDAGAEALKELELRLATGPGAGEVTGRILEWAARFPRAFAGNAGPALVALGGKAAARAGLPRAAARLEPASRPARRRPDLPVAPREPESGIEFVMEDASTRVVFAIVEKIAPTSLTLLVLGESGTGKEIVAKTVHRLSGRPGPLVAVNVAALSATLVESELFGHARGAFTGADREHVGSIETSSGGTLFLDEVGDLPLGIQPKLLRVLQEKEIRRVGEARTRRVDLRVVAATHRDLKAMTAAGTFREDLYYRLAQQEVVLAPLRERPHDLETLLGRALSGVTLSTDARRRVLAHSWPGNVRELLSAIESARALAAPSRVLEIEHLPGTLRAAAADEPRKSTRYFKAIRDAKTSAILGALERNGGNRTRAAADLGLSRQSLLYEIKKLHIGV